MFSKYAAPFSKRLINSFSLRLSRHVQTDPSYLHNPGSEPLTIDTLGNVIEDIAHKYPGRVAIRSVYEDVSITYEELLNKADSLGCALRANGFEKGDRLGIWGHNSTEWIITMVAAARAGLVSVLLNPVYEKDELSFCINKVQLKGMFITENIKNRDYYGLLNKMIPDLQTSKEHCLKSNKFPSLKSIISAGKEKLNGVTTMDSLISNYRNNGDISKYGNEVKPEEETFIMLTSGTTGENEEPKAICWVGAVDLRWKGEPKGAVQSHIGVVNNTYFSGKRMFLDEDRHTVCIQAPLFHALGSLVTLLGSFRHGSTVVLPSPVYNVAANLNALRSEKCTIITGTPTMYVDILANLKGELGTRLRVAMAAGAPCSPRLIRQMHELMQVDCVQALYGLTETTACVFQSLPSDSVDCVAETVGYITDHVELKVINSSGNTVPFGTPGELLVRGYGNMMYYWDEPGKTQQAIQDGWFYTGDLFTISPDGYGRIVGRLKDIIVRGGENIAPKEIEDILNTHPAIVEAQVIGVSDERLGEELCVAVRVRENATFTIQDMSSYCSGKLARFKIPRILKIVDNFPKTGSGKIQKHKLKELIDSGKI